MRQFGANVLAGLAVTILSSLGTLVGVDVVDVARNADGPTCGSDPPVRSVSALAIERSTFLAEQDGEPLRL